MSINLNKQIKLSLLKDEEVLYAERKHWITLLFPLLIHPVIIGVSFFVLLFVIKQNFPVIFTIIAADLILCAFCVLAVVGTFVFMDWYFEFYVITNKRLIVTHFFRIVGMHYDEIFHESDVETEISHVTKNWLYDMLKIENVLVNFRNLARTEPFIFDTPNDPLRIERILDHISLRLRRSII